MKKTKVSINFIDIAFIMFYSFDMFLLIAMKVFSNNLVAKVSACFILYLFLFIGAMKEKKAIKKDSIAVILFIYFLFLITGIVYPKYKYALFDLPSWNMYTAVFTFYSGIFGYLFFRLIDEPERILKNLTKSSYICFIWAIIRIYFSVKNGGFSKSFENGIISKATYDMAVGYKLLFCSIIYFILIKNSRRNKIFHLILLIICFSLMTIYGSRTAVASFILFIFLYVFTINNKDRFNYKMKKVSFVIAFGIIYFLIFNNNNIQLFQNKLDELKINSRILNTLAQGNIELDYGRDKMWSTCLGQIRQNMFIGSGIYSDRYLFGIYCHQMILEILMDFGIILGGLIIFVLLKRFLYMIFQCKNKDWKLLFIIFFSMIIIRLNVSSSFWHDTNFWACLAIIRSCIASRDKDREK